MSIDLAADVEDFLREQVRAGVCTTASELVNDLVRSVREQRQKTFEVTPELEAWLLKSAEQSVSPLTRHDFDGIRERARARRPSTIS
jgi:Arc/MetJ-type ribon-helix-helix transcriptional regulator